jgi:hypothetical protein
LRQLLIQQSITRAVKNPHPAFSSVFLFLADKADMLPKKKKEKRQSPLPPPNIKGGIILTLPNASLQNKLKNVGPDFTFARAANTRHGKKTWGMVLTLPYTHASDVIGRKIKIFFIYE